jgi:16S rRNA (uracil1498-N3)-methyltransferase
VVERDRRASLATFYCEGPFGAGDILAPSDDVFNHLRARRIVHGEVVRLSDGVGHFAMAMIHERGKRVELHVSSVAEDAQQPPIHLRAPIADRDRMLWLAEKATELGVATWQNVRFRRSASVTPRGEGDAFANKARARMVSALEQSGSAWLPGLLVDADLESIATESSDLRVVMDPTGTPLLSVLGEAARGVTILVGPEGGIEDDETAMLEQAGWRRASLGASILRFETAAIAAIGVARAAQTSVET